MENEKAEQIKSIIPSYTPMRELPEDLTLAEAKEMFYRSVKSGNLS